MRVFDAAATREALPEPQPEVLEEVSQLVLSEDVSQQVLDQLPEVEPTAPFSLLNWVLLNWVLLVLAFAGVSMTLGYLAGSMIGKH